MLRWFLGCVVIAALAAPVAAAPVVRADRAIAEEIGDRVRAYTYFTIFDDVQGDVRNGIVTLTGKVTAPHKVQAIGRIVAGVRGVREVLNKLEVTSASPWDDHLRAKIAQSIYGDDMFLKYAVQPYPSIHVIVDRGHVTLTGVVDNELERRRAEMIARGVFGSFSVKNNLRVE